MLKRAGAGQDERQGRTSSTPLNTVFQEVLGWCMDVAGPGQSPEEAK
jgi:hypothetical protein